MTSTFDIAAFDRASARTINNLNAERLTLSATSVPSDLDAQPLTLSASPAQHSILNTAGASETPPLILPNEPPPSLPGRVSTFYTYYKGRKNGPYYVRRWKEHGKPKKQYVKAKDLESVKEACARHRFKRNETSALRQETINLGKNIAFLLTMLRRSKKGGLRILDYLHIDRIEKNGMSAPGCPPLRAKWVFMAPLFANFMNRSVYGAAGHTNPSALDPNLWMQDGKPIKPLNVSYLRFTPQGRFA